MFFWNFGIKLWLMIVVSSQFSITKKFNFWRKNVILNDTHKYPHGYIIGRSHQIELIYVFFIIIRPNFYQ